MLPEGKPPPTGPPAEAPRGQGEVGGERRGGDRKWGWEWGGTDTAPNSNTHQHFVMDFLALLKT